MSARGWVNTTLPVFEYFVQNTSAAATESGTRASVFYLGESFHWKQAIGFGLIALGAFFIFTK